MKLRIPLVFLMALPLYAADEMRQLDWMVGEWKGEAWVRMGAGEPEHVLQHERVQPRLGGRTLLVEGTGKRKLADGAAGEVVHEALAVVSFDDKTKQYRFDAWTARDGYVEAWFEAGANTATWGFDTPQGGKVRYTISLNDKGQWYEVGEFSRDGKQYMKFFEMTLTKSK